MVYQLLGADEALFPYAYNYLRGMVWFIPTISLCFYFDMMLKSLGKPITSTVIMSLVVLLNIVLSLLFVLQLGWGIIGTSIATGIAFSIAALISGAILLKGRHSVRLLKGHFSFSCCGVPATTVLQKEPQNSLQHLAFLSSTM